MVAAARRRQQWKLRALALAAGVTATALGHGGHDDRTARTVRHGEARDGDRDARGARHDGEARDDDEDDDGRIALEGRSSGSSSGGREGGDGGGRPSGGGGEGDDREARREGEAREDEEARRRRQIPKGPVFGGRATRNAAKVWLSSWRNLYVDSSEDLVPKLEDKALPKAFRDVKPKVVLSTGGAAGGVVTEGMGYGMMVEGIMAAQGDGWALQLGLGLTRAWLGMVQGPGDGEPLGGADTSDGSAAKMGSWPYGVSAVKGGAEGAAAAGMATWKYPKDICAANAPWKPCHGSATDGDEDAVMGMIYLAAALEYPEDFVDMTVRAVIAFASADLGFPDMYRVLPDGQRVYVPKAGSQWGGLTPPGGQFHASKAPWCYAPAYFAPAHYRTFRDFVKHNWHPSFDKYLPAHLDGKKTTIQDLADAFDGAILAGYNILYYSSCLSGTVSNWVGVEAPCKDNNTLACNGVPWANTPYVGKYKGQCASSGTKWGAFGADASRMPWRLAMDYALFTEESEKSKIYSREGAVDPKIYFNARVYLNRIATQYKRYSDCDGGVAGGCGCHYPGCKEDATLPYKLEKAFAVDKWPRTPGLTCDAVPHHGQCWWAGFMSYPTFTAFVAPYQWKVELGENNTLEPMTYEESSNWLDTFVNICDFTNFTEEDGWLIHGKVCQRTYFHVSQEAISTMIMAGNLKPLASKKKRSTMTEAVMKKHEADGRPAVAGGAQGVVANHVAPLGASLAIALSFAAAVGAALRRRVTSSRAVHHAEDRPLMDAAAGRGEKAELEASNAEGA